MFAAKIRDFYTMLLALVYKELNRDWRWADHMKRVDNVLKAQRDRLPDKNILIELAFVKLSDGFEESA